MMFWDRTHTTHQQTERNKETAFLKVASDDQRLLTSFHFRSSAVQIDHTKTNLGIMTGETNKEDDNQDITEVYENQFKEIDSELDALRFSLHEDEVVDNDRRPPKQVGGSGTTVILDEITEDADTAEEYDDDDLSTLDESLSLHVGKLQAALAQQSAQEMERIVQTLREQQQQQQHPQDGEGNGSKHDETSQLTMEIHNKEENLPSSGSSIPRWMVFLVLMLTLLCVALAWQMWSSSFYSSSPVVVMYTPAETMTTVHVQQTYTRQICRTNPRTGQQVCESDQTSQHQASSSGSAAAATSSGSDSVERQIYYHQRQEQCQYVNGQSYCESYEESRLAPTTSSGEAVGGGTYREKSKVLPSR
jgi:hypothetical protein